MFILKVVNLWLISNYCPISLISSIHKISTLLVTRIKSVLGSSILEVQIAFLPGRQILDGVLATNELVDWARSLKKRHFMFKVDFEEACNLVSWGFLDYMLMRLGFGDKWTKLIYVIVSSSFTLALVNRGPIGEFKA